MEKKEVSLDLINQVFKDIFYGGVDPATPNKSNPVFKKHEWEENGERYYCWEIITGNGTVYTGDAGAQNIINAMEEMYGE